MLLLPEGSWERELMLREPSLWTQADYEVKQIISSLSLFVKQE